MRKRVLVIVAVVAALLGAGLTAGASAVTGNPWPYTMTEQNSDGLVIEGSAGPNNNAFLVKDHLNQPIFSVLEAGGAAVMGDNFRVLGGDDIYNAAITVSPYVPSGACPKANALWVGPGNIWKCVNGSWRAPRTSIW